MYLIPKNIKVKREIFKGFGIIEIIALALSIGVSYLLSLFAKIFYLKIIILCVLPLAVFILLLPLPNGVNALFILRKFFKYSKSQKKYKYK